MVRSVRIACAKNVFFISKRGLEKLKSGQFEMRPHRIARILHNVGGDHINL